MPVGFLRVFHHLTHVTLGFPSSASTGCNKGSNPMGEETSAPRDSMRAQFQLDGEIGYLNRWRTKNSDLFHDLQDRCES